MNAQKPSDCWYYANDKKKVGPVRLDELRSLHALGVLKREDMVFQEGTTKWRPLLEVVGAKPEPPRTGWRWKLVVGGGVALFALAACGLVAILAARPAMRTFAILSP